MTDSDPSDYARNVEGGKYICRHCGGGATNRIGGEHIWTCSEIVPIEALEDYHSNLLDVAQQAGSAGEYKTANVVESFANELQELIEDYE